jgi:flagellar biosynthetic protein FlhB
VAEDVGQERTQQATPRRKQQARERGQVMHSRELNTMFMLLGAAAAAYFLGPSMTQGLADLFRQHFSLTRDVIFDASVMPGIFVSAIIETLKIIAPFFVVMVIAAIAGPLALGGVTFSTEVLGFKYDRIDPVKGLQRIFSLHGFVELFKAMAKFMLIAAVAILVLYYQANKYFSLGDEPVEQSIAHAGQLLIWGFFIIATTLIIIAALDLPFQIWDYNKQIKMTFQEIKDESKDTDGNPEVRGRVKRMQREMAQRRMMAEVPKADVIVTNPEHYSVALRYDQLKMRAPVVVAKGTDLIAFQIRTIAREHDVPILESPLLARALHHTTELKREIPAGLYLAVAKVLAYVFQLKRQPYWQRKRDLKMTDLPIPDDMQFDQ